MLESQAQVIELVDKEAWSVGRGLLGTRHSDLKSCRQQSWPPTRQPVGLVVARDGLRLSAPWR
jgi:hypothetical protein